MDHSRSFLRPVITAGLFLLLVFSSTPDRAPVHAQGSAGPPLGSITSSLEILIIPNVGYSWQTVSLENSFSSPVPICAYQLPSSAANPAAIRIRNLTSNSFEIKIQRPPDLSSVTSSAVYCIVAEEGLHTLSDGRNFEAHRVISTTVSGSNAGGWSNGQDVTGQVVGTYTNPAVLGQVITYNNASFSTFWSYDCDSAGNPPFQSGMGDGICVGRHVGELSTGSLVLSRDPENLGYIVVEGDPDGSGGPNPAGVLTTGTRYEVALGPDSIDGPFDGGGSSYSLVNSGYSIGVATQNAMDGNNGGWAVLYGANPLAGSQIDLAVDEDTLGDTERSHTTEQVAYWVFENDPGLPWMESLVIPNVGSSWQTVTLNNDYSSLVPVCTYNLPSASDSEAVVRIQNINNTSDSFQIRIQKPRNSPSVTSSDVHCIIVEEGTHTLPDVNPGQDRILEAHIVFSDQFNENNNWNASRMENVGYVNSYNSPVVLGQVITYNDPDFSTFWTSNGTSTNPPSAADLYVGKHVGEDPGTSAVADETLGYLIVEGGSGFSDGFFYEAGLGGNTIAGVGNSPPYSYSLSRHYSYGVATQSAENGGNGGWAVLYGADPFAGSSLDLAIDEEDAAGDTSRTHTTEQVAYWVFHPVLGGTAWNDLDVDGSLDPGEPIYNNLTIYLCPAGFTPPPNPANCLDMTTTDGSGDYAFFDVASGTYQLAAINPNLTETSTWGGDHDPSLQDQVDDGAIVGANFVISNSFTWTVSDGSTFFDFGFAQNADFGGTVWDDADADGSIDGGESGLNNVEVWICPDSHPMPPSSPACYVTYSDASGNYYFRNFTTADYYFAVRDPDPLKVSTLGGNHDPSANDQIDDGVPYSGGGYVISQVFSYLSTTNSTSFDFGYSDSAEIGGIVWDDSDGDGIQNGSIIGIPNVDVELFDGAGSSIATTTTAANGTYLFTDLLAGNYSLTFTPPAAYLFSPANVGGDDSLDSDPDQTSGSTGIFSIAPGTTDLTWDAGIYPDNASIFDPPSGWKSVDRSGWPTLVWRQVWINDGNASANLVRLEDPLSADVTYVGASLVCTATGSSSTTNCSYDALNAQIIWEGTIAPDPGAVDEFSASNEVVILFETTVNSGIDRVENQGGAFWDENGDGSLTALDNNILSDLPESSDDPRTAAANDPTRAIIPPRLLPDTGYAPARTDAPRYLSLENKPYSPQELSLVIPTLESELPIVLVPYGPGFWDTSWLGDEVGYLEGSAYPTFPGNTVLTAHVWDAYNQPGPFFQISELSYGDEVLITSPDQIYHYQIQSSVLISEADLSNVLRQDELDWLSLLTCENWDATSQTYTNRRLVRAVLVMVRPR